MVKGEVTCNYKYIYYAVVDEFCGRRTAQMLITRIGSHHNITQTTYICLHNRLGTTNACVNTQLLVLGVQVLAWV